MRTYRNPMPDYQASEQSSPLNTVLGAKAVESQSIMPAKALGRAIVGVHINMYFTSTQSGKAAWNPSELFKALTVTKGTKTQVKLSSYDDLERYFNILTGLTDAQTNFFNDLQSAGDAGQTSSTLDVIIPLHFSTETPPQFKFEFNPYTSVTNGTAGSCIVTIDYYYASISIRDDYLKVITAPAAFTSGTETDITTIFNENGVVNDVFLYIGNADDSKLTSQTFEQGSTTIFDTQSGYELRAQTTKYMGMVALAGFLGLQVVPTSYPAAGSQAATAAKTKINLVLGGNYTPIFYLVMQ